MKSKEVVNLIQLLSQENGIIDARTSHMDDEVEDDPWILPPSKKINKKIIADLLPNSVTIILSNLIYIEIRGIPSILINGLKKLAAFQNPEFYKAQALRLPTYDKPRVIGCSEDFPKHIGLPRGCLNDVLKLLNAHDIKVEITDQTYHGNIIDVNFSGQLYSYQEEAVNELKKYNNGVLVGATAFGKTVVASWMIAERKANTLILVHRHQLMEQWRERLSLFLNIPNKEIGIIGGGKQKATNKIDIAMLQSLFREKKVHDIVANYGHIIIDECHHISAFGFEQVMKEIKAHHILGLTATPIRKDGHHPIILMQCGPIRYHASNKVIQDNLKYTLVVRHTSFSLFEVQDPSIQDIYRELIANEQHNESILNDVLNALKKGRSPLLLTERVQHLEWFSDKLKGVVKNIIVLKGGMSSKQQRTINEQLKTIPDNEERIILATGRYIGEGFDDARLDTLFLAMPISWQGTLQQYVGRLHRKHQAKQNVQVYDYVDSSVGMLAKMYEKRLKKYRAIGYVTEQYTEI